MSFCHCPELIRLLNIVHSDSKLYLVFEFLDMDLKKYMDHPSMKNGMEPAMVKVSFGTNAAESRNSPINSSRDYTIATRTECSTET